MPELTPPLEFEAVAATLRDLCKQPLPDLAMDTTLNTLPGMDSLKALHAIAMMEEHFGVELDIAFLDHNPDRVSDIVTAVQAARAKAAIQAAPAHTTPR